MHEQVVWKYRTVLGPEQAEIRFNRMLSSLGNEKCLVQQLDVSGVIYKFFVFTQQGLILEIRVLRHLVRHS